MSKTVRMENEKILRGSKFLWFKPSELGRSWTDVFTYTCDICERSAEFKRWVHLGLYTGLSKEPLYVPDFTVSKWGHKNNEIVFCDCHKESEIDAKIEELKTLEKGCQPQEARDER